MASVEFGGRSRHPGNISMALRNGGRGLSSGSSLERLLAERREAPYARSIPSLTEEQARRIYRRGEEAVVLGFLIMARKLAALSANKPSPTAPSGMIPGYQKTATRTRGKKPGGKPGHKGHFRARPAKIDRKREHRLPCCPDCQGRLKRCAGFRTRIIEDIPEGIAPIVTEHTIRRDWCPRCRRCGSTGTAGPIQAS